MASISRKIKPCSMQNATHGFHPDRRSPRQQHHIQLDGRQPGRLGGFQPVQHLRQTVAASDLGVMHSRRSESRLTFTRPPRLPSTARPAAPTGRHWWTPTNRAAPAGRQPRGQIHHAPAQQRARRRSAAPAGRKSRTNAPITRSISANVSQSSGSAKSLNPRGCSSCNASRSGR